MSNDNGTSNEAPVLTPDPQPLLLVGNPTSHSGKAASRIEQARRLFNAKGIHHEFRSTLPDGRTVTIVSEAIQKEGFRTVVSLGGDGTFHEVAKGICISGHAGEVRLGMLPSGTANDQGKSFGISSHPKHLEHNIEIIQEGHVIRLDVGELTALSEAREVVRRDLFFDSVGWGLSAAILSFRNREKKAVARLPIVRDMYRDHAVYIRAAARELALSWFTRDRFTAELTVDDEVHTLEKLSDLLISNTTIYAGEWIVDPASRPNDGLLEIAPFTGVRDWTSKLIVQHKKVPITEEMLNRIGIAHAPTYRGSEIHIQILRPNKDKRLPAQIDGEEFPPTDLYEVRVYPQMINLIVPINYHWI